MLFFLESSNPYPGEMLLQCILIGLHCTGGRCVDTVVSCAWFMREKVGEHSHRS